MLTRVEGCVYFLKAEILLPYGLTAYPVSFFKDGLMYKPNKALFPNALLTYKADVHQDARHVLDGEALTHKVCWSGCTTFGEIFEQYVKYVKRKYVNCSIVFRGYSDCLSKKDHEHIQRSAKKSNTKVHCTESSKCSIKQDVFLANGTNKQRFIAMLSKYLRGAANKVVVCKEEVDTQVAECPVETAGIGVNVIVAADADLLLFYHRNDTMADITITSEKIKATFGIKSSINNHIIKTISSRITYMDWV